MKTLHVIVGILPRSASGIVWRLISGISYRVGTFEKLFEHEAFLNINTHRLGAELQSI